MYDTLRDLELMIILVKMHLLSEAEKYMSASVFGFNISDWYKQ